MILIGRCPFKELIRRKVPTLRVPPPSRQMTFSWRARSNFIQKQSAARPRFVFTALGTDRAGESAFFITKNLALDDGFGNSAAIDLFYVDSGYQFVAANGSSR